MTRPQSASHCWAGLCALATGLAVIMLMARGVLAGAALGTYLPFMPCLAVFLVLATLETTRRPASGNQAWPWSTRAARQASWERIAVRLLGAAGTVGLLACVYWLLPEYASSFYRPYWAFLRTMAPLALLVPVYFIWYDMHGRDEHDEYFEFGRVLCGEWEKLLDPALRHHLLGWVIKGFFLPLMCVYLAEDCQQLIAAFRTEGASALAHYNVWFNLSYTIDLLFCVVGYTVTTRLFDCHIRSVEPTMTGWVVALVCYQPFYSVLEQSYLRYQSNVDWDHWLAGVPPLRLAWGAAIIALSLIYALSTVAFGLRFSNLTHRGIITDGPYRFSKHPAYISKNLSWWLISVPFVAAQHDLGWLRNCIALLAVNSIYFMRARTEERHLSRDPAYVQYANWINEHGLLRVLGRTFSLLRYHERAGPMWP